MTTTVEALLAGVHAACVGDRDGRVADHVPEATAADPDAFGLCLATADGQVYEAGDTRTPFAIQSISKAFTYGLALEERGVEAVGERIDVEPSGDAFNEISLDPVTGRPRNPMINAGAIAAAGIVAGEDRDGGFERILRTFSACAGRELPVDEALFAAEMRGGYRNRAIANLLRGSDVLDGDPEDALHVYLRQCSVGVECRDLALMAATLAAGGRNPRTGARALSPGVVERVLSVMTTCGMYDAAGDWVASVGLPAKSGVGGGVIAVLPGQLGIAVFSPRLDQHGNSVRGVEACRTLSRELELHFLHVIRGARSAVRASYDVADVPSLRQRPEADAERLRDLGRRVHVHELQGDLLFSGAESVVRRVEREGEDAEFVVLDTGRVDEVSDVARRMLLAARDGLRARGCETVLVDPGRRIAREDAPATAGDPLAASGGPGAGSGSAGPSAPVFRHVDAATAWCEDRLLERHAGERGDEDVALTLADHPLLAGIGPDRIAALDARLETLDLPGGTDVVAHGDAPHGLFLVMAGRVDAVLRADGTTRRVATLGAGTSFGERSLVTGHPHRVDVRTDGPATLRLLRPEAFSGLCSAVPGMREAVLEALVRAAYDAVERAARAAAARARAAAPGG